MTKKEILAYLKANRRPPIRRTGKNKEIYKALDSYFRARVHDGGAV